jgi:5-methylcytosine-specific restriction endonuclease McrA
MKTYKLLSEIVPSTSWYNNVRSNVSKKEWDYLRKKSYESAGHKCEICGDTGKNQGFNHNVECHEIWEYDDSTHTQKLTGLISLCPYCHKVKHPGLAGLNGETDIVLNQLMKVNEITEPKAKELLAIAWDKYFERSLHDWKLDISYLENTLKEYNEKPWYDKL